MMRSFVAMVYRRTLLLSMFILALGTTIPTSAGADVPEELGQAERTVLGWHPDSKELFVRLSSRGERMVSGTAQPFFFATTEVYGPDGKLLERYKAGLAVGPSHPVYFAARPATDLIRRLNPQETRRDQSGLSRWVKRVMPTETTGLESVTLDEPRRSWRSPTGEHLLTFHGYVDYEPWEHPFRGTQYKCVHRQRAVLLDGLQKSAHLIAQWEDAGEPAALREDAPCPRSQISVDWHPDATHWALTRTVIDPSSALQAPDLRTGRVGAPGPDAVDTTSPFLASTRPSSKSLPDGEVRPLATLAMMRQTGELPRPPRLRALYSQAIKDAKTYADYLILSDMLLDIDLTLARQALERALKEAPEDFDVDVYNALLVEALVSLARERDAQALIQAMEDPSPLLRARAVELSLRQIPPSDGVFYTARLLFRDLASCRAYLAHGLALGRAARAVDALHQFQAAYLCDPDLTDALYYWADLVHLRGQHEEALGLTELYLNIAKPRRGDDIRQARRARFEELRASIIAAPAMPVADDLADAPSE